MFRYIWDIWKKFLGTVGQSYAAGYYNTNWGSCMIELCGLIIALGYLEHVAAWDAAVYWII